MKSLFVYIIAYLVLLTIVLGLMFVYPKPEFHLLMNAYHASFEDTFFKYYTLLAEWPLYLLALFPLFWKKLKLTLFFAMSELTGGAFVQLLKHLFSEDRPVAVFEHYPDMTLPLVQGVDMHHSNSFPSGHASTFFMFCTCLVIILAIHYYRKKKLTLQRKVLFKATFLMLLFLAALGAYSRVYLSQHFLSDVCVGSIIGFTTPFLIYYFCKDKILKLNNKEEQQ